MSLLNIVEPIYTQIKDLSTLVSNQSILGIADSITAGTHTLGGANQLMFLKIGNTNDGLDVISTSASDTSNGSGARTIAVEGLYCDTADGNRYKKRRATYTMAGTSAGSLLTGVNSFAIVNKISVLTTGSVNVNVGSISAKISTAVCCVLKPNEGVSKVLLYGVQHGKSLLIKSLHISSYCQTAANIEIEEQDLATGKRTLITKLFLAVNTSHIDYPLNHKVNAGSYITANITNLETPTGTNHICAKLEAIET
tara:strand:+ start:3364 stop:4122 length:759 start_codon:yes stop_codon:yes gene_type:complete